MEDTSTRFVLECYWDKETGWINGLRQSSDFEFVQRELKVESVRYPGRPFRIVQVTETRKVVG